MSTANQEKVVLDMTTDSQQVADQAIADSEVLEALIEQLSGGDRRARQFSSAAIRMVSRSNPELLTEHVDEIADALHRPEAQTRWEVLEVLVNLINHDAEKAGSSFSAAETALWDEDSGSVRLAAFDYFTTLGAISEDWSDKTWEVLDEAIVCYHGDPEFADMLTMLTDYAQGDISENVVEGIRDRLAFDATGGKGYIKRQAKSILAILADRFGEVEIKPKSREEKGIKESDDEDDDE